MVVVTIAREQKHTKDNPCGVCHGYDNAKRGQGERCYGFASIDGKYANCTRDDHAGGLQKNPNSDTYSHHMVGRCKCGTKHTSFTGPAITATNSVRPAARKPSLGDPVAIYQYGSGAAAFDVLKVEPKDFRQRRMVYW